MVTKDGTEPAVGVTPATEAQETPKEETYSKTEVEKLVRDRTSAVLADIGRSRKAAEDALARLTQLEKERAEEELEAFKDDPIELTRIREKQQHKSTKVELDRVTQELNAKNERLKILEVKETETLRESQAKAVATKHNVDVASLLKFTDGSPEKMEELAKILPKTNEAKKPLILGSNLPVGGKVTFEQVRELFSQDPYNPQVRAEYMRMRAERKR